jgi:hypothetical protein
LRLDDRARRRRRWIGRAGRQGVVAPSRNCGGVQIAAQEHRISTQGSKFPSVLSLQFQSQISCLHGEIRLASTTGDHLFKARSGFAQVKPADVAKAGSFATQTIMTVYCRPKSALTAYVLSYVLTQLCSHTASVVEQVANPLARAQLCAQAWANGVIGVAAAPPAAETPPVEIAPPVVAEPPGAGTPPTLEPPTPAEVPPVPPVPPVAVRPPVLVVPPAFVVPLALVVPP